MEQYPIPQFIEQESRIAVFLTFKQFFYLIGAGALCFFLWYIIPGMLFYVVAVVIFVVAAILAFGQIYGTPLPTFLMQYVGFLGKYKNFVWQKKEAALPYRIQKREQLKKVEQAPSLSSQQNSHLKDARKNVEFNIKN